MAAPPIGVYPLPDHYVSVKGADTTQLIDDIANGVKTAEGRVNVVAFEKLEIGHAVYYHNHRQYVVFEVIYKKVYPSFIEMIRGEGLKALLPFAKTEEEGIAIYEDLPEAKEVHKLGALAIGIRPLYRGKVVAG